VSTPSSLLTSGLIEFLFWTSCAAVTFAYLGYPLFILLLARLFGRKAVSPELAELPSISLLIAAHNEEAEIEARILNVLALDYPADKLEIVIASDGSTDRTNEIVRRYASRGVQLYAYQKNSGKSAVLNKSVPRLRGDIVILSDANTHMAPNAARKLVAWFGDHDVGVVCGRLVLSDPRTGRNVDSVYWKYETFLKKCESQLGALLGSNGAIYAIRKELFPAIRAGILIDDFVIPLEAKRHSGRRIIYDTDAIAYEETAPTILAEFRRRVRIGAGGFQSICMLWPLLLPTHGWVALTFFCHKILRWSCPFLLIAALVTNLLLVSDPLYAGLLSCQVLFYALSLLGNWIPSRPHCLRYLRLPTMFTTMNLALFFGFLRWLRGGQTGIWSRTDRSGELVTKPAFLPQPLLNQPLGAE
jgi:cellulose synthase/poly-beta-1,6-N-acetylglucosamine synthase-like glycosyltransferase